MGEGLGCLVMLAIVAVAGATGYLFFSNKAVFVGSTIISEDRQRCEYWYPFGTTKRDYGRIGGVVCPRVIGLNEGIF